VLAHLFFGNETVRKLIEHQVRIDGRHAVHQDYQHPFHRLSLRVLPAHKRHELVEVPVWLAPLLLRIKANV